MRYDFNILFLLVPSYFVLLMLIPSYWAYYCLFRLIPAYSLLSLLVNLFLTLISEPCVKECVVGGSDEERHADNEDSC